LTDLTLGLMADSYERPAVAGSGAIACGLAACASALGEVRLLARSDASARRAEGDAREAAAKLDGGDPERVVVTTDVAELAVCDLVVEAIVEDLGAKGELLAELGRTASGSDFATTTSSLSVAELGDRAGHPERFFGLHVFNPVIKMQLIELCFPSPVEGDVRDRAARWCEALGKRAVEVPDQAGFVVNRLLFPFLFDAVRLQEDSGMDAEAVDACMTLGAGHPMGPLELLDFVGLDVAVAIGEELHRESGLASHEPPQLLRSLVSEGKLGRKSGAGLHDYG
jgi:3-hydroxybutyryl-CoA dehydrogenase